MSEMMHLCVDDGEGRGWGIACMHTPLVVWPPFSWKCAGANRKEDDDELRTRATTTTRALVQGKKWIWYHHGKQIFTPCPLPGAYICTCPKKRCRVMDQCKKHTQPLDVSSDLLQ